MTQATQKRSFSEAFGGITESESFRKAAKFIAQATPKVSSLFSSATVAAFGAGMTVGAPHSVAAVLAGATTLTATLITHHWVSEKVEDLSDFGLKALFGEEEPLNNNSLQPKTKKLSETQSAEIAKLKNNLEDKTKLNRLLLKVHPDKNPDISKEVSQAFNILKDFYKVYASVERTLNEKVEKKSIENKKAFNQFLKRYGLYEEEITLEVFGEVVEEKSNITVNIEDREILYKILIEKEMTYEEALFDKYNQKVCEDGKTLREIIKGYLQ